MEHIGTVAASLSIRLNSHGGQLVKQIVPIAREDDLPMLHVLEFDRDLYDLVRCWEGGARVGYGTPVLRRPFSATEQSMLEHRAWELSCAVAPVQDGSRYALLQAISAMLGAFPNMQRLDQQAAGSMAIAYLSLAQNGPPWAIVKTCQMVRLGAAGLNPSFCPTEPEFNIMIRCLVDPYVKALERTERLIKAIAPPSPPKPTRAEIEAKLGHPLSAPSSEARAAPVPAGDGKHAQRVFAELAARKARREANPEQHTHPSAAE